MSNTNHRHQGVCLDCLCHRPIAISLLDRPYPMPAHTKDDVEALVNACLDTSGIDRRYNALILEELRDCTNLTHDQLRQAAFELTNQLRLNNPPQHAPLNSSRYDSATTTNVPSPDERLYQSSNRFPPV